MSDQRRSEVRLTDAVPGLRCPKCGEDIFPGHSGDALHFYCARGHEANIRELAGSHARSARFALDVILQSWELTVRQFEASAADARARGLHSVAEIFHRQIGNLQARIRIVRAAIEDAPSLPTD